MKRFVFTLSCCFERLGKTIDRAVSWKRTAQEQNKDNF